MSQPILAAALAAVLFASAGIARAETVAIALETPSGDPLESFNRTMYRFNKAVLEDVINPTVDTVGPYTPAPVVTGLGNAYNNLTEIEYVLNGALRRDATMIATSAGRFVINTTVGIAGLFDVATPLGLHRQKGDFGEAMCAAGVPPGPYVVLPLAGPANVNSAGLLAGGVAVEVYLLSFISTVLATADFLVIDLGGSAAALRYATDIPPGADGYSVQRGEYESYIKTACVAE
jgi:phospholipid-binding lipoprotein MlaA